jgi:hypothetical protein
LHHRCRHLEVGFTACSLQREDITYVTLVVLFFGFGFRRDVAPAGRLAGGKASFSQSSNSHVRRKFSSLHDILYCTTSLGDISSLICCWLQQDRKYLQASVPLRKYIIKTSSTENSVLHYIVWYCIFNFEKEYQVIFNLYVGATDILFSSIMILHRQQPATYMKMHFFHLYLRFVTLSIILQRSLESRQACLEQQD